MAVPKAPVNLNDEIRLDKDVDVAMTDLLLPLEADAQLLKKSMDLLFRLRSLPAGIPPAAYRVGN